MTLGCSMEAMLRSDIDPASARVWRVFGRPRQSWKRFVAKLRCGLSAEIPLMSYFKIFFLAWLVWDAVAIGLKGWGGHRGCRRDCSWNPDRVVDSTRGA